MHNAQMQTFSIEHSALSIEHCLKDRPLVSLV
jgi:hypothetical protein